MSDMDHFDGEDPENFFKRLGVDPSDFDALMHDVSDKLRKHGVYVERVDAGSMEDDSVVVLNIFASVGDLAFKRAQKTTEDDSVDRAFIEIQHGIIEDEVRELRERYSKDDESPST